MALYMMKKNGKPPVLLVEADSIRDCFDKHGKGTVSIPSRVEIQRLKDKGKRDNERAL